MLASLICTNKGDATVMKTRIIYQTIDTHTGGQPTRTIYGGVGNIPGKTMSEKMLYLKEKRDDIRQLLMFEPRGNDIMSGVILTEPCTPGCDIGVIYLEVGGYLPMCGHDTIGVATALMEIGMLKTPIEPYTELFLDTPAGVVKVKIHIESGSVRDVTFENVPAFVFKRDAVITVPGIGNVKMDISYGGNFYALIRASDVGLKIIPEEAAQTVQLGQSIRGAVNTQMEVFHPEYNFIRGLTHVQFYEPIKDDKCLRSRNAVVIPDGTLDRSPCGTGSSARLASLFACGELAVGERFINESIIGSQFECRILREERIGEFVSVIPEITGSAYVTGIHSFFVDHDDPFQSGFQLKCF